MKKMVIVATISAALGSALTLAYADKQPMMKEGLRHLEQAVDSLEKAAHDKGGHRVKAIEHAKEAIKEVKAGIEADNKN
jgi:hypothetical protein